MTQKTPKKAQELLSASAYADILAGKEGKFERGEDVSLDKLPKELQDNVKDPPESVQKVTDDMQKQGGANPFTPKNRKWVLDYFLNSFMEHSNGDIKDAVDHLGPTMGVDFVTALATKWKDVRPDLWNRHGGMEAAEKVAEKLYADAVKDAKSAKPKQAAELLGMADYENLLAGREAKFERGKSMTIDEVAKVVGPEFKEMNVNPPESVVKVREEMTAGKTAGAGLYGHTKDIESVTLGSVRRLQASVAKIAKEIYAKDEETPQFLLDHSKRSGSRAAKLLIAAMKDLGPGAVLARTAGARNGLYGYRERTAKLALTACSDLYYEAGMIAGDLHGRRTAHYDRVTGFLREHSKTAKCGFSSMLLQAYPSLPAQPRTANENPSVAEILALDIASRVATDFLAGATVEEPEGRDKEAGLGNGLAVKFTNTLQEMLTAERSTEFFLLSVDAMIDSILKPVKRLSPDMVEEFRTVMLARMTARVKPLL